LKLLIGLMLYFICGAGVIVFHALRAATPGVHAAPFFWWMTVPWWQWLLLPPFLYLVVFLIGIRPARWYGTRLLPLVLPLILAVASESYTVGPPMPTGIVVFFVLLIDLAIIRSIFFVVRTRDYA
jgi:hypothetical protein